MPVRIREAFTDGTNIYSTYLMARYVQEFKQPVIHIPVKDFRGQVDWILWGGASIRQVLKDPKKYSRIAHNIKKTDLREPIFTLKLGAGHYIMDGYHRLAKAISAKKTTIAAIEFTDVEVFKKFKIGPENKATNAKMEKITKADLDKLYVSRFKT